MQDGGEVVFGHGGPVKGEVGIRNLKWRRGQTVEKKASDNAEVSPARAAAGTKKIGIMLLVDLPERDMSFAVDGEDLDR